MINKQTGKRRPTYCVNSLLTKHATHPKKRHAPLVDPLPVKQRLRIGCPKDAEHVHHDETDYAAHNCAENERGNYDAGRHGGARQPTRKGEVDGKDGQQRPVVVNEEPAKGGGWAGTRGVS